MKNKIYSILFGLLAITAFNSCAPYIDENPEAGLVLPPDASEMDFSVTAGNDDYHFNLQLVSPNLSGIYNVTFDLGNGSVVKKEKLSAYYPLPGEYKITMTITTNGGSTSISKSHTTTETDFSIFTDEKFIALTGGINNANGKTWVVDAESQGHFGVGSTNSDGLEWWSAAPFAKEGTGAYDDELTFKLEGFAVTYENHGVSYVKSYMKDDPNLSKLYLNSRLNKDDWDVDYVTPVNGTWFISERDGKSYLSVSSTKRIFPGLDVGALNNEYEIVSITENYLELTCFSSYENWTKWHFRLRNKEYEKPKIKFDVNVEAGADVNEYVVSLINTDIPVGQSIDKVVVDFGDGTTKETDNYMNTTNNVYMRAGNYPVKIIVTTSVGTTETTQNLTIAENHPDYQEFLLDEIVMYADFSEVMMAPVDGQDCFVSVEDNPSRIYPNKSSKVAFYSKSNQEWANAFMQLTAGYRFDLRKKNIFKMKVYGKAGDKVLLKLENTDREGNSWQTGTADLIYEIKKDNTWEIAEYSMQGVSAGWDWTGDQFTNNVVADDRFNHGFYNIIRIMLNPAVGEGTHEFYFDELAGPHVEGLKSANIGN